MTTADHLQRIRAKCVELLAIAEKRSAGWSVEHGAVKDPMAEAGWRATIAAIDGLGRTAQLLRDEDDTALAMAVESELDAIIAAWPEELL